MYAVPEAICSLWATGAENLEAKGERSRTVEGPCTRNRRGGPRNYEAAQVLNHIPLNAVPEAICSLRTTGAENLEEVAGPCTPEGEGWEELGWFLGVALGEPGGRRGRAAANAQRSKLSKVQTFKLSKFQTFKVLKLVASPMGVGA